MLKLENSNQDIAMEPREKASASYVFPDYLDIEKCTIVTENTLWHRRIAHMNMRDLCQVHRLTDGVPKLRPSGTDVCRACQLGKAHKLPLSGKFR